MAAYYNEFKPEAAHMLRELIHEGLIADGEVDERSITEVSSDDIKGFTQCHFFAGIGGWSVALRLALWGDDRPVWTGSCPCQPFSSAGKQKGHGDERHLWPHWARLIRECSPPIIFGEQVAGAIAFGWWDDVSADLETEGYACASAVLPACSVGKPHKRDRLWFVADRYSGGCDAASLDRQHSEKHHTESRGSMGDTQHNGWDGRQSANRNGCHVQGSTQGQNCSIESSGAGEPKHVADTECRGRQGQGALGEPQHPAPSSNGKANQFVDDSARLRWIECPDGKARPVEPSIRLLAHGVQHRAPVLHAFGNAIVPQVAAEFIKASEGYGRAA